MSGQVLLATLFGVGVAAGVVLLIAGWNGWRLLQQPLRVPITWAGIAEKAGGGRLAVAVLVVAAVAMASGWPVLAAAAGVLAWVWPLMFGSARASRLRVERLEALTTWTESLRDTIAGAIGLEQAIVASAQAAPDPISAEVQRLAGRLGAHVPLPQALHSFASEFDDASADLVMAALILNARLRGPGLVATLSALTTSAREELDMRRMVEAGRRTLRAAQMIMVGVTVVLAGGLVIFSGQFLQPYDSIAGQAFLVLVMLVFVGTFVWINRATADPVPDRILADVPFEPAGGTR